MPKPMPAEPAVHGTVPARSPSIHSSMPLVRATPATPCHCPSQTDVTDGVLSTVLLDP